MPRKKIQPVNEAPVMGSEELTPPTPEMEPRIEEDMTPPVVTESSPVPVKQGKQSASAGLRLNITVKDIPIHLMDDIERTKYELSNQPYVSLIVPLEQGEVEGKAEAVIQINGYRVTVKKGMLVSVPEGIAMDLMQSAKISMDPSALSDKLVSRASDQESALN